MDKINRNKNQTTKGNSQRERLHKGTVLQPPNPGQAFTGLGVAKRYCRRNSGDRFMQGSPRPIPGTPPGDRATSARNVATSPGRGMSRNGVKNYSRSLVSVSRGMMSISRRRAASSRRSLSGRRLDPGDDLFDNEDLLPAPAFQELS